MSDNHVSDCGAEIRFYHLQGQRVDAALPALLEKALLTQKRIVLRLKDAADVKKMDRHLWTYKEDSFLPHGVLDKTHNQTHNKNLAQEQPIFLCNDDQNPAGARILICAGHANIESTHEFDLTCILFEDHDQKTVQDARTIWSSLKDEGGKLTYWQQNERGVWENKAST